MNHATFTRQTRRIHPEEFLEKQQYTKDELDDLLGLIPAPQQRRGRPKKNLKILSKKPGQPITMVNHSLCFLKECEKIL